MLVNAGKLVTESMYHNPDPLVHLLACANETKVVVEGLEMTALVDAGSQICPHRGILYRNGVEDPSIEELDKGCCVLRGWGCFNTIQRICRG